jgi:zinc D-Ala-D-Ala dipeptidase
MRNGAILALIVSGAVACGPATTRHRGPVPAPLVDLATVDATIDVALPYATAYNFTGTVLYPRGRCLLRRAVAERLARVQSALRADRLGLRVWDCYRPFSVQQRLWRLVPDPRYVAEPVVRDGRPVAGSKHNRGAAVDVTLVEVDGRPLEMPSGYDDFTERAHRGSAAATPVGRANADRLARAMTAEGFIPLPTEWWHFDAPGWDTYDLLDEPL